MSNARRTPALSFRPLVLALTIGVAFASGGCDKQSRAERMAERGDVYEAAQLFDELGDHERAGKLYEQGMAYTLAAMQYEKAENWAKAGEVHEEAQDYGPAIEAYEKAENWDKAGELSMLRTEPGAAATFFEKAGNFAMLGQALEAQEKFEEAAHAYEKGGDFSGFGRMLEKANKPLEAAAAYEKGKNFRAAAVLYEQAEKFPDAARNAAALAERDNGTDAKLLAARLFTKTGETERAAELYAKASEQAQSFGNFAAAVEIAVEAGTIDECMNWTIERATALLDEGRASEAAEALIALNAIDDDNWRKLDKAHKKQYEQIGERMLVALEKLPEVPRISGHNSFLTYDTGFESFEHAQFEGAVFNKGEQTLSRVELEISLFQKDFDSFVSGADGWGAIPDELTKKFEEEEAGFKEVIVLTNIAPGETREFSQRLGALVPYKYFSHHIIKAETAG